MASVNDASGSVQRARIVARYDKLLEAFGEDPFQRASVCQRTEDVSKVVDEAHAVEERKQLLVVAAQKSLRCAELIEQALEASARLSQVQRKITRAYKEHQDGGDSSENEDADMDEDAESEQTVLLLEDLVAVGDEMQDLSKKYAHLGVAGKTARASRELLSIADQNLQESMESLMTGYGNGANDQEEFRDLYMEEFTTAFGDDLDHFRQEERFESRDVTYLISCIHAGGDIFSPLQKKLFVESVNASKS